MQARDTAVVVFDERDDAEDAIRALRDAGFRADDIGLVVRDRDQTRAIAEASDASAGGTEAGEGAAVGAVAGGILGGLGAWLVGIGSLAIPVVGPVIAAGAFATALVGAAVGAGIGAIAGALIGMGIPEEEANWYEERVRGGAWLVTVRAGGRYAEAQRILREYGGHDYVTGTATTYRPWNEAAPEFRAGYERQYGAGRYEPYEPAHRFGYESYGRYRDASARDWETAEPELRRDWERQGTANWDEHRGHIRHGYDYGRGRTQFRDYGDASRSTAGGLAREAAGTVERTAGQAVGSPRMEAEGEAERLRGREERA